MWQGRVDDRCLYCDGFLEPQRFSREIEEKINKQLLQEDDYLYVRSGDGDLKKSGKKALNFVRWWAFYAQIAFFLIATLVLVIVSLVAF